MFKESVGLPKANPNSLTMFELRLRVYTSTTYIKYKDPGYILLHTGLEVGENVISRWVKAAEKKGDFDTDGSITEQGKSVLSDTRTALLEYAANKVPEKEKTRLLELVSAADICLSQ